MVQFFPSDDKEEWTDDKSKHIHAFVSKDKKTFPRIDFKHLNNLKIKKKKSVHRFKFGILGGWNVRKNKKSLFIFLLVEKILKIAKNFGSPGQTNFDPKPTFYVYYLQVEKQSNRK